MIVWTKAVHIAALAIWCAGLLALPSLLAQRGRLGDRESVYRLHRLTRALFINVTSPAAFVAVLAGTVLIFLREAFTPWMMLKLAAVGALVVLHVRVGYLILHLFDPGGRYARWRQALTTGATIAVISAILWLVLAKPRFDLGRLPEWLRKPGGLQSLLETMSPMP
jgi:protoporphyrinogen IX oxidase